jgi:hypothetical protein
VKNPIHRLLARCAICLLFLPVVAALSGCSSANAESPEFVSGTVTYRGQPITDGTIQFAGSGDKTTILRIVQVKNGRYELSASDGLPPGSYRVEIFNHPPGPIAEPRSPLPAKYNTQSKLTAVIAAGQSNVVNFALD